MRATSNNAAAARGATTRTGLTPAAPTGPAAANSGSAIAAASSTAPQAAQADQPGPEREARIAAAATRDQAAAAFIAELSASLVELARAHRFDALAYLFDLAVLEAKNLAAAPASRTIPPRPARNTGGS